MGEYANYARSLTEGNIEWPPPLPKWYEYIWLIPIRILQLIFLFPFFWIRNKIEDKMNKRKNYD